MRSLSLALTASCLLFSINIPAQPTAEAQEVAARIYSRTGMKVDEVRPSPVAGLYELSVGRKLFYVDAEGRHLIAGRIYDTVSEKDLTAQRLEELSRISWSKLPLNDAIKITYGKGERKVVVFTDTKCRFCSMLENSFEEVGNVTVYNFIYPILNSNHLARDVVCSKNPAQTLKDHLSKGLTPPAAIGPCDSSVLDRNLALGARFGLNGTPAIIFEDGSMHNGAMPPAQLENALQTRKALK